MEKKTYRIKKISQANITTTLISYTSVEVYTNRYKTKQSHSDEYKNNASFTLACFRFYSHSKNISKVGETRSRRVQTVPYKITDIYTF